MPGMQRSPLMFGENHRSIELAPNSFFEGRDTAFQRHYQRPIWAQLVSALDEGINFALQSNILLSTLCRCLLLPRLPLIPIALSLAP
jgi:hypothetical protein